MGSQKKPDPLQFSGQGLVAEAIIYWFIRLFISVSNMLYSRHMHFLDSGTMVGEKLYPFGFYILLGEKDKYKVNQ